MACIQIGKGEQFSLNKSEGIERVMINLNWKSNADIDISAFLVGEDGLIQNDADFVFYNSETRADPTTREYEPFNEVSHKTWGNWKVHTYPMSADGSVILLFDDRGNDEEEDYGNSKKEECLEVDLSKISPDIKEIFFCATIYRGDEIGKTFGEVSNLSIILLNIETKEELCCYNIKDYFSTETAVEAAKLVRNEDGEWEFEAVGKGYDGGMQTLIDIYI